MNDIPCGRRCEQRGFVPAVDECQCASDRSPQGQDPYSGLGAEPEERGAEGMRPEKSSEREAPSVQVVEPLTDDECDRIAAQTMDRVAAAKGLEHATYLNTDISVSHTLRRELIRAGLAQASALPAAQQLRDAYASGWNDKATGKDYRGWDLPTQQPAEPVVWQPIETAPKDGRKLILFYRNSNGKARTVMAKWVTDDEAAETDADGVGLEGGWYECIDNWDDYCQVAIHEGEPTHWMPLPPPPASPTAQPGEKP